MKLLSADAAGILYPSAVDIPRKARQNALRICSWNMNEGAFADPNDTQALAADIISKLVQSAEVDLLVLQEVPMDANGESQVTTSIAAKSGLRYASTTILSPGYVASTHSGIGVLARFPLSNSRLFQLPNPGLRWHDGITASFDKGIVAHDLEIDHRIIVVSAIHSFPFHRFDRSAEESEFREVWDRVVAAIDDAAGSNAAIVVGDFNTSNRKLITGRTRRDYQSIMRGILTHGDRAADDILISENLSLVGGPYAVWSLSDHLVCIADISFDELISGEAITPSFIGAAQSRRPQTTQSTWPKRPTYTLLNTMPLTIQRQGIHPTTECPPRSSDRRHCGLLAARTPRLKASPVNYIQPG